MNHQQKSTHATGWLSAFFLAAAIGGAGCAPGRSTSRSDTGLTLSFAESAVLHNEAKYMASHTLTHYADLSERLGAKGIWIKAAPDDMYLKQAEKNGDTPYAYTLSSGKSPSAIVLAPRFFTENLSTASRASLMIHEMGHYEAYVATGKSDEFDGYKTQYDVAKNLGLTETDGLIYFMMLDGVEQYVVPRDHSYADKPDVKAYMTESKQ